MPYTREFHRRNAARRFYFYATDVTNVPLTATSPTGKLSKDGAAFANCTNLPVSVGNGLHYVDLTATETDAEKLGLVITATNVSYQQVNIVSDSNFESSRVNLIGSTIGSGTLNITNAATGNRTIDIVGSGELIRLRTDPHGLVDTIAVTANNSRMNNFLNVDGCNGASFLLKNGFVGMDIQNNTIGLRMLQNNTEIQIDHRHLITPGIIITAPTGARYDLISIINPSTGMYHAVNISCPSTGGGNALNLMAGSSGAFALNISNTHPTGFGMNISGILSEPAAPFDKDSLSLFGTISFISSMMSNKRALNKNSATDTLYYKDGSTPMFTRSVSDDGTTQTVNATD